MLRLTVIAALLAYAAPAIADGPTLPQIDVNTCERTCNGSKHIKDPSKCTSECLEEEIENGDWLKVHWFEFSEAARTLCTRAHTDIMYTTMRGCLENAQNADKNVDLEEFKANEALRKRLIKGK